jgi:23S rRNA (cytosine1962-C5)-methyltransferase
MQKNKACLTLKKGKERNLLQRHHWIYSGAIGTLSSHDPGDIADVFSASGQKLGMALLNDGHSIAAHMIAFGDETLEEALRDRLSKAFSLRQKWFDPSVTNAIRLINAEGDGIPGLIIDSYANVLVLQISHPGVEKIKDLLLSLMIEICKPKAIVEKSTSFLRKKEGMGEVRTHLYGPQYSEVEVLENGLVYSVNLLEGQKTGFFLDQRDTRKMIASLSNHRRVLNCFAYTGGFSISALSGGASQVDSVEISGKCKAYLEKNIDLNHLSQEKHQFIQSDVFDYFKTCRWNYDIVILDPPAFVKKRNDVDKAFRAYKDMNQEAMTKMAPNTLLLTCSCSYHIEETLFQNILFRAAKESNRSIRILSRHRMAFDHPISIFHPESAYLKSFLLAID